MRRLRGRRTHGVARALSTLPWLTAPRAGLKSPLTLVVAAVTALLSCFLAMAAVLHASAAAGATVAYQQDKVCPDSYGPVFNKAAVDRSAVPTVIDAVERQAARHGFATPTVSMFGYVDSNTELGGKNYRTRMAYRDGGLDHLQHVRGDRSPGLWVGRDLADSEHIALGTRGERGALPPVTGVYADLYNPAPRYWCSVQDLAVQNRLVDTLTGSVVFATDRASFDEATASSPTLERLTITFPSTPPTTLADAEDRTERAEALIAAVDDDLSAHGLPGYLPGGLPFERSVEIASEARGNVAFSILPLAVLSVLVGCAGIGTVGLQWYQRRHARVRLLSARGASPVALGMLAVAELGVPVLVGGSTGMVLARVLLPWYGPPGRLDPGAALLGSAVGAAVLALSTALLATVVAVRTHREFQLSRASRARRGLRLLSYVPWELGTAALAVVGWTRLASYGGTSGVADPLPQVDPIALTYPVSVVLTVGLLAARVVWLGLHASHRARLWSRPPIQLAIRRLASARAPVTGVLVIGVLAVGTLAVGTSIATGQRQSLADKSGALVGAETRVDTETPVGLGQVPLPEPLRGDSTVVGQLTSTGTDNVVLVVDPATFQRAAWTEHLPDDEVRALLSRLGSAPGAELPALRVGHTPEQATELPELPPVRTIADLDLFPLIGSQPGYVVSRDALTAEQLEDVPQWTVLSSAPLATVTHAFNQAGIAHPNAVSRATALDALPFYLVGWTFSFVTVLGAVLGVVAVLALLVAVEVRRRQNALSGVLMLRMGLRPAALLRSHLIELGALAGVAVLTGVLCGITVAGISIRRFDPARWLAPGSELPNLTVFLCSIVLACLCVVAGAGWLAMRSVRLARTAELLRV